MVDYGQMSKLKLAIISERTRYHFQKPLENLKTLEVFHFYKSTFSDMDVKRFKNLISYQSTSDLKNKLAKLRPDLVQGLEPYYGYSRLRIPLKILSILFATQSFCKNARIPYFFHVLENIPPEKKYGFLPGKIMRLIAKRYADGAKFIYYLNDGAKKNLVGLGQQNKIHYGLWGIWGVDVNEFSPSEPREKTILFVGRLNAQKGVMDFIEALEMIDLKDFKVKIAGVGPLKSEVLRRIQNSNLRERVEILGSVPSHEIAKLFAGAYLFVSPCKPLHYWAEQVGMTNIEAMACGVPVVGYESGSISEFVINGKTGILVKEGDVKALSKAIKRVVGDSKLQEELSKNARDHVLENYDAARNVRALEKEVLGNL